MNNLFSLIKVNLTETLDFRKFKQNKAKTTSFLAFILLFGLLFFALSFYYNYIFVSSFHREGAPLIKAFILFASLASLMVLTTGMFRIKAIFIGKDYDMLTSMPIKKKDIILSKLVSMYLIELLYSLVILLPTTILCTYYSKDAWYLIFGLILILFVPGIPLMFSAICSLFITLVADRYRFANVISVLFYIAFFGCIMYFSYKTSSSSSEDVLLGDSFGNLADKIKWINPTLYFFEKSFTTNKAFILVFVLVSLLVLVLSLALIALLFNKVHEAVTSYKANRIYKKKTLTLTGQFKTLLGNEYKRLFTSKLYFINSISSIIATVFCVIMCIVAMREIPQAQSHIKNYAYLGSLMIIFTLGISTTSTSGISIEGQNFWMIKTLPIDYKKYINAKLLLSISVLALGSVISSTIVVIYAKPEIFQIIVLYLSPLIYSVGASILGLIINLHYYKLKWKNEADCLKRSAAVFIVLLLDFLFSIIIIGVTIGTMLINKYIAMTVLIAIPLLFTIILYAILNGSYEKLINRIEEF